MRVILHRRNKDTPCKKAFLIGNKGHSVNVLFKETVMANSAKVIFKETARANSAKELFKEVIRANIINF